MVDVRGQRSEWAVTTTASLHGQQLQSENSHTLPVKSLDALSNVGVFLYLQYFLHCRKILKASHI